VVNDKIQEKHNKRMFFLTNNIADKKKNRDKKVAMFAR